MKNKLSLLFIIFLTASCNSKNEYKVMGTVKDGVKEVYLTYSGGRTIDTIAVKNNKFEKTEEIRGSHYAKINIDGVQYPFFLDEHKVVIDAKNQTILGSKLNNRFTAYRNELKQFMDRKKILDLEFFRLMQQYNHKVPDSLKRKYEQLSKNAVERTKKIANEIIDRNQDNVIPAFFLINHRNLFTKDELIKYCSLDKAYTKVIGMEQLIELSYAYYNTQKGKKFMDVDLVDPKGEHHKLSEYIGHGQYILLNFWASWSSTSKKEERTLKDIYTNYHKYGLGIISISLDTDQDKWMKDIEHLQLNWIQLSNLKGWHSTIARYYGVRTIPTNFLIDPKGNFMSRGVIGESMIEKLNKLVKTNK